MHARLSDDNDQDPLELFLGIGTLILESRVPEFGEHGRGYGEGPHCPTYLNNSHSNGASHACVSTSLLCKRWENLRKHATLLWQNGVPLCMEVLVGPECYHGAKRTSQAEITSVPDPDFLLIEKWTVGCAQKDSEASIPGVCLLQAVRSFLHFSQLSAWYNKSGGTRPQHLMYRLTMPGQAFGSKFAKPAMEHNFPVAYVGNLHSHIIKVSVSSYPRTDVIPRVKCAKCNYSMYNNHSNSEVQNEAEIIKGQNGLLGESLLDPPRDQRSRSRSGSRSVEVSSLVFAAPRTSQSPPGRQIVDDRMHVSCTRPGKHVCCCKEDEMEEPLTNQGRRGRRSSENLSHQRRGSVEVTSNQIQTGRSCEVQTNEDAKSCEGLTNQIHSGRSYEAQTNQMQDERSIEALTNQIERRRSRKSRRDSIGSSDGIAVLKKNSKNGLSPRIVPTRDDKLCFQMSLTSAASLVFHSSPGWASPPSSSGGLNFLPSPPLRVTSAPLLGSFEESLLNGRLQPASTVEGFRAELGASGAFCPSHQQLPVSVFFYSFGGTDAERAPSPYLAHVNLGPKGYQVPRRGTIQLTLFNPQGTVVKMFVVLYDLTDMPANSKSFLRQRTYFMPANMTDTSPGATKWLRYLIHLRFCTSKSGRLYLHTDVRMVVLRKSDVDTASVLNLENSYEWKSFTRGPSNPRFSPQ